MNRYTKLEKILPKVDNDGTEHWIEYIEISDKKGAEQKLFQFENIEEELGIDLITLFKALRDSIAIKNEDGTITVMWACPRFQISLDNKNAWILYGPLTEQKVLNIKDYGKTWALTEEELE